MDYIDILCIVKGIIHMGRLDILYIVKGNHRRGITHMGWMIIGILSNEYTINMGEVTRLPSNECQQKNKFGSTVLVSIGVSACMQRPLNGNHRCEQLYPIIRSQLKGECLIGAKCPLIGSCV